MLNRIFTRSDITADRRGFSLFSVFGWAMGLLIGIFCSFGSMYLCFFFYYGNLLSFGRKLLTESPGWSKTDPEENPIVVSVMSKQVKVTSPHEM